MRELTAYEIQLDLRATRINLASALNERARLIRPRSTRARRLDEVIIRLRRQQMEAEVALQHRLRQRHLDQIAEERLIALPCEIARETQAVDQS